MEPEQEEAQLMEEVVHVDEKMEVDWDEPKVEQEDPQDTTSLPDDTSNGTKQRSGNARQKKRSKMPIG